MRSEEEEIDDLRRKTLGIQVEMDQLEARVAALSERRPRHPIRDLWIMFLCGVVVGASLMWIFG